MSELYIKVDEHTPIMLKALVVCSAYKQKWFAEELGLNPSNLSAYLNGKKKMSKELCDALLRLLDFNPKYPYLIINQKPITTR